MTSRILSGLVLTVSLLLTPTLNPFGSGTAEARRPQPTDILALGTNNSDSPEVINAILGEIANLAIPCRTIALDGKVHIFNSKKCTYILKGSAALQVYKVEEDGDWTPVSTATRSGAILQFIPFTEGKYVIVIFPGKCFLPKTGSIRDNCHGSYHWRKKRLRRAGIKGIVVMPHYVCVGRCEASVGTTTSTSTSTTSTSTTSTTPSTQQFPSTTSSTTTTSSTSTTSTTLPPVCPDGNLDFGVRRDPRVTMPKHCSDPGGYTAECDDIYHNTPYVYGPNINVAGLWYGTGQMYMSGSNVCFGDLDPPAGYEVLNMDKSVWVTFIPDSDPAHYFTTRAFDIGPGGPIIRERCVSIGFFPYVAEVYIDAQVRDAHGNVKWTQSCHKWLYITGD